jgi:hypothetical protein
MVLDMKAIGKMIFSMALEKKSGLITQGMRANILKGRNMEEEPMCGLMGANMKEIGMKIE